MSFRCEHCNDKKYGKPHKIVTKTRLHEHPRREGVYKKRSELTGEMEKYDDPGGVGEQIVEEKMICDDCKADWDDAKWAAELSKKKKPQAMFSRRPLRFDGMKGG